jgi:hypothetical protein
LTYVAVADGSGAVVQRHVWTGDRAENKRRSAAAALELLLERVDAQTAAPGEEVASTPEPDPVAAADAT